MVRAPGNRWTKGAEPRLPLPSWAPPLSRTADPRSRDVGRFADRLRSEGPKVAARTATSRRGVDLNSSGLIHRIEEPWWCRQWTLPDCERPTDVLSASTGLPAFARLLLPLLGPPQHHLDRFVGHAEDPGKDAGQR